MTTSAIAPISTIDILEQASVRPAPTRAMAEKFTDLMRRNTEPSPIEWAEKSTMVEVLMKQDEQMVRVQHESYDMAQANTEEKPIEEATPYLSSLPELFQSGFIHFRA